MEGADSILDRNLVWVVVPDDGLNPLLEYILALAVVAAVVAVVLGLIS